MGKIDNGEGVRLTDQQANRMRVLRSIRRGEPIARTEVAAHTGMTTQAVSDVVADLMGRGLLLERPAPARGPGRPRRLLQINPDNARVVGAFLFPDHRLGVEIADLRGETLFGATHQLSIPASLEALAPLIASAIEKTIADAQIPKVSINSIGLGFPGLIDSIAGVVLWSPRYRGDPVPLASLISEVVRLPVYLDSAPDVLTRAEHWHGADRQVDDFVLIFVGFGAGLGRYADGRLVTGDHGTTPAFAHVKVTPGHGPVCLCGARGCLITYASISGVVARIDEARGLPPTRLDQMTEVLQAYAADADGGDAVAKEIFDFAGLALGAAAANYINVCDPSRLMVVVQDRLFTRKITETFKQSLKENTHPVLRLRVGVDISASEEIAFAKGAAALLLESLYLGE